MDQTAKNEKLRNRLKFSSLQTKNSFDKKYPHIGDYLKEKGMTLSQIRDKSARILSSVTAASTLFLAAPTIASQLPEPPRTHQISSLGENSISSVNKRDELLNQLSKVLPEKPQPISPETEKKVEDVFSKYIGVDTKATLEGQHLNTTYGYIGAEQHLYRYPGDTLANHGNASVLKEGIAPGLGAWGYFSSSKNAMTADIENVEKWYAVCQTLYLPEWGKNTAFLREWYKYRKVLIVNTDNGNAVVAAIADSGPAAWTGKHFGGSPEVMMSLGGSKYKKGSVIFFFVNDPDNKIPLGPVDYSGNQLVKQAIIRT